MRLPIPVIFAALVVAAAGSVLVTTYFKSAAPYVLNLSGLTPNGTKVVELGYIPSQIRVVSNNTSARYEISIYIDGTFVVTTSEARVVAYNEYRILANNGTVIDIKPVDVKSTHVKIAARRT
jgi:hypothetical protein